MTDLALNKKLWTDSIAEFTRLYDKEPSTAKDWSRISHIYTTFGGQFTNKESIIPICIKKNILQEGVFANTKAELVKLFKNPVILGIALYFLNNLYKKTKR